MLFQGDYGGDIDIDAGPGRDVVQDDRTLCGCRHRLEMQTYAFLRGAHVRRRRDQEAGWAQCVQARDFFRDQPCVAAADAHHDRTAGLHGFHHAAEHPVLFMLVQRRGFAGGAAHHQAMHAGSGQAQGELLRTVKIKFALPERRDERNPDAFKDGHGDVLFSVVLDGFDVGSGAHAGSSGEMRPNSACGKDRMMLPMTASTEALLRHSQNFILLAWSTGLTRI